MPSPEIIQKVIATIKRASDNEYFFDQLKSPSWIKPLWEAGFFRDPVPPIREGQYIRFPFWPESRYLARMAQQAPRQVLEVAQKIPIAENVRVFEDLADAALAMPPKLAMQLIPQAKKWLESPYQLLLPMKLGELVAKLATHNQGDAALDLARSLLAVLPDPKEQEKLQQAEEITLPLEPQARFGSWEYEHILKQAVPPLVKATGLGAVALLSDLLDDALLFAQREREKAQPEDYSFIWHPAIEGHQQNHPHEIKHFLVSTIRDAAEQLATQDEGEVSRLVSLFEVHPWKIFRRLAFHLLQRFPSAAPELIADRLSSRENFDDPSLRHEYTLLVRIGLPTLPAASRAKIFRWIKRGPNLQEYRTWYENQIGKQPTDDNVQEYIRAWQRDWLARLEPALPEKWKKEYDQLVNELGPAEHPEFAYHMTIRSIGLESPLAADELRSMSIAEISSYLREGLVATSDTLRNIGGGPSPEGLGQTLTSVVGSDPKRFAEAAAAFQGLRPIYINALFRGFEKAAEQKRPFPWSAVLDLCLWAVSQELPPSSQKEAAPSLETQWTAPLRTIPYLLTRGFQADVMEFPFDLRSKIWQILYTLTEDASDPSPAYEARDPKTQMDPPTLAINTVRGKALHAVVDYAVWVRRQVAEQNSDEKAESTGFRIMTEVQDVLDKHLNPDLDSSLAIRSVYGQRFPWLVFLDQHWAAQKKSNIFPLPDSLRHLWAAAWETFIVFCNPQENVLDLLREEYAEAIERIGTGAQRKERYLDDPEIRLTEHLMVFYWHGKLNLDPPDELLIQFYKKAPDKLRTRAIEFLGHSLHHSNEPIPEDILYRLQILWQWRYETLRSEIGSAANHTELEAFGWWFGSGKFVDDWALRSLEDALKLANKVEASHLVVERLDILAATMPLRVVECLRLMVVGSTDGWHIDMRREQVRSALLKGLQSSNAAAQEAAVSLIHQLGARGYREFRDLLPEQG